MHISQRHDQAVNITQWRRDAEFAEYPEGARDKTLVYCPNPPPYPFLKPGQRYLFKRSSPRYPEQFWAEIFAYVLGLQMDVTVPPTFVAFDTQKNQSGALIEWFLSPEQHEVHIPGGDFCQQYIPHFDRKKGRQHNFDTVVQIFTDLEIKYPVFIDWKTYWAKAFTFDALIGNTDRHQDNWGIIETFSYQGEAPALEKVRMTPVFDNGTSMGHEIFPKKFIEYENINQLEKYIARGWHHMKWSLGDTQHPKHISLLKKLAEKYPLTSDVSLRTLNYVNFSKFNKILEYLISFDVPVRLTAARAIFMLKLIQARHRILLRELETCVS